jgi:phage-related protein (TIGR01555 family)
MTETDHPEAYIRQDGAIIDALYEAQYQDNVEAQNDLGMNSTGDRRRLSWKALEELSRDWLGKKIVSVFPDEATRKWTEVSLVKDEDRKIATAFETYEERIEAKYKFNKADWLANIYGGAALLVNVDDGLTPDQPVNTAKIKTIKGIYELDPQDIRPYFPNLDAPSDDPDLYQVFYSQESKAKLDKLGSEYTAFNLIHKSRIIRFDGSRLPPRLLRSTGGWGDPLIVSALKEIARYTKISDSMAQMIQDHTILLHKMKNLQNLIKQNLAQEKAAGGAIPVNGVPKTLTVLSEQFRSMKIQMQKMGAVSVDSEDDLTYLVRNYQGLSDMKAGFQEDLVAAVGIPYTMIFGRGPKGLSAGGTGETEDQVWSKTVSAYQEQNYRHRKLDMLYKYIWLAQDGPTKGKIPEGWSYKFKPLYVDSRKDAVANETAHTNMLIALQTQSGAITKDEVRASLYGGPEYSYEVSLDKEAWEKQKQDEEAAKQQQELAALQGFGGDQGGDYFSGQDTAQAGAAPEDGAKQDSLSAVEIASRLFKDLDSPFARMWVSDRLK